MGRNQAPGGADKHQVDFIDAMLIFEGSVFTKPDLRRDYGEERFVAVGFVGTECFVVVYTDRNGVRRLISAWRGGRTDYEQYQAHYSGRGQTTA
jgi:uncharacterized DUF497 family protein